MKSIAVEDAVGQEIIHELTGIIPHKKENIVFKKGHIIRAEDVAVLKDMGKYHIHILEEGEEKGSLVHENEGALMLAEKALGRGVYLGLGREGKVPILAEEKGLLNIDASVLKALNYLDGILASTAWSNTVVEKDQKVAVLGITPLFIESRVLKEALSLIEEPVISVAPFYQLKIGMITTGTEIFEGRIKDGFLAYANNVLAPFNNIVAKQVILPDSEELLEGTLQEFLKEDYDLILLTGGMSVDADDLTKKVLRELKGASLVTYGSPVLPGAMFMASYYGEQCILGLPAGLLRGGPSIFDKVLPSILAKQKLTKDFIAGLGHGGLL